MQGFLRHFWNEFEYAIVNKRFLVDDQRAARSAGEDTVVGGCPMKKGDRVLLPFPAGNRDPDVFDQPDQVTLDREVNRHFAFGVGIHRCLGSNLARMELRVTIQAWLDRIPDFAVTDVDAVTWSAGQVRGPRTLPLTFSPLKETA